ncbi:MAG: hypothetical protein WC670_19485 [Pseudolabrys sp.]|jgi:hypothetical protein
MDLSQSAPQTDEPRDADDQVPTYTYRASALGAPFTFRLTDKGIAYESGRRSGLIAYRDVRRVRLSFKPSNLQFQRFVTNIWADRAPKLTIMSSSWKSMVIQQRQDKDYSAFVGELHRRLAAAGAGAVYERGVVPFVYWPGLVIVGAITLCLAWLIVRALQTDAKAGAAFIAAFLALFLWQGGSLFSRNRPGLYGPDTLPVDLLP